MDKRYLIFISSTYEDLIEEREKVIRTVLEQDCFPASMEFFPAVGMPPKELIQKVLKECDYYILIIGARYGSIDNEGISYTENEFNYAVDKGIPVLAFLHGDIDSLPLIKYDKDITTLLPKLKEFRDRVEHTGRIVLPWTNAFDLSAKVSDSLREAIKLSPRPGWVRTKSSKKRETVLEK